MGMQIPVLPHARPRRGPLLFVPARWQRPAMLMTLKRVHAWTGFWGAALFLLMGTSGVLLNHRAILPIDAGGPVDVDNVLLPVAQNAITDETALGKWAKHKLRLAVEPKPLPAMDSRATGSTVRFMGQAVEQKATFGRIFYLANEKVTVTYVPGSSNVTAKVETLGMLAVIKNLHKGTGLGIAWVLLIDTIAGALIAMSLTGMLLWSRLHGPRLAASAIACGAIAWALIASVPLMG